MTVSTPPASLRRVADACGSMLSVYRDLPGGRPFSVPERQALSRGHQTLMALRSDAALNGYVAATRAARAPGRSWTSHHRAVHDNGPRTPTFEAERHHVCRGHLTEAELMHLFRRASKTFGKRRRTAARETLPLTSNLPVGEALARLFTDAILDLDPPHGEQLPKKARDTRRDLVARDVRALQATAVLLLNAEQQGHRLFQFSFALAAAGAHG